VPETTQPSGISSSLKTATTLGLSIPPGVPAIADEVIE
jgi:hypothetical protein